MLEPWITIAAAVIILGYARLGASFGLFCELPNAVMLFIAMLVSLRFWHPIEGLVERLLQQTGGTAVVIAFWVMLILACVPMIYLLRHVTEDSRPVYPRHLNGGLGFVLGLVSASIFFSCVMLSATLFMPKLWPAYDRNTLFVPWDRVPLTIYRHIEGEWLGIKPEDPGRTLLPNVTSVDTTNPVWE